MSFGLFAADGAARAGRLSLPHGPIDTPAFMPVGTYGAVKGMRPAAVRETEHRSCSAIRFIFGCGPVST